MDVKQVEIRDRCTTIPALALRISKASGWVFSKAGFGWDAMVVLIRLSDMEAKYDPHQWEVARGRTMHVAHKHLLEHWDEIPGGEVLVDVEFVLGETLEPKKSERSSEYGS